MKSLAFLVAVLGFRLVLAGEAAPPATPVVYTNADLERMFGPSQAGPGFIPSSSEADWSLVESVLDRERERLEAERQLELERIRGEAPPPDPGPLYPAAWRLGFPASVWWKHVWCAYSGSEDTPCPREDVPRIPRPR